MKRKLTLGDRTFDLVNNLLLLLVVVITLYPFLYIIFASFSDPLSLIQHRGLLYAPLGFSTAAYKLTFSNPMIAQGYLNTIIIVIFGTIMNLFFTTMSAFVLSRKRFKPRNVIMLLATFTMFFNGGLVPFYLQVRSMNLQNTYFALWLPTLISTFNLIILRNAYAGIPDSVEESARIDGANEFIVFAKIMTPLIIPSVAVIVLYCAVGHWNGWFNSMLFLSKRETYPLQLILREILINNSVADMLTSVGGTDKEMVGETVKYATIVIATVPIICIYPFLQKYFVHGVMVGSVKG